MDGFVGVRYNKTNSILVERRRQTSAKWVEVAIMQFAVSKTVLILEGILKAPPANPRTYIYW